MLFIARQTTSDKILYKQGSVYQLPYQDEQFKAVTMFTSFHWFCSRKAVKEISRVLEPDAFIYIVDCSGVPFGNQLKTVLETQLGYKITHSKKDYKPKKVLSENGFKFITKQDELSEDDVKAMELASKNEFSIAHIQECVVRSLIDDISVLESTQQLVDHKKKFKNSFQDVKAGLGFTNR